MKTADISDADVCRAYATKKHLQAESDDAPFADAILREMFPDAPDKVIRSAMERALRHDLINFGVSLRSGWLTEKGAGMLGLKS